MKPKNRNAMEKKTLRLKDNHSWTAPKGYKIVVLDRGLVSFNIPANWQLTKLEPVEIYDKAPPKDNARLSVSFWKLPAGVNWSELPLIPLLAKALEGGKHEILERGDIEVGKRDDLELVWTQHRFQDPIEDREAYSRIALARGWNVQVLITFDIWVDELKKRKPVWDEVLRSLQLGRYIADPTVGMTLQ